MSLSIPPTEPPTDDELVLKQFAAARKNLASQKVQAKDDLNQSINRQKAISGLTGGRALKAASKAHRELEEGFSGAGAGIDTSEAQARQQAGQFAKQFGLQEKQFGLQKDTFAEQQRQFNTQMAFQNMEFNENKKTNILNAITALQSSGIGKQDVLNWLDKVKQAQSMM